MAKPKDCPQPTLQVVKEQMLADIISSASHLGVEVGVHRRAGEMMESSSTAGALVPPGHVGLELCGYNVNDVLAVIVRLEGHLDPK